MPVQTVREPQKIPKELILMQPVRVFILKVQLGLTADPVATEWEGEVPSLVSGKHL